MTDRPIFDPAKYVTRLEHKAKSGKVFSTDYLEVKWRLVWLREVDPQAVIETEHIRIDDVAAIFKARVTLSTGGSATGYGNVNAGEFPDYIGKCETVALGRALAALGFGTQFAGDFQEERIADSPVRRPAARSVAPTSKPDAQAAPAEPTPITSARATGAGTDRPTPGMLRYLEQEAKKRGYTAEDVEVRARQLFGRLPSELSTTEHAQLVEWAKAPAAAAGQR
jgi:hypothetical protein